MPASMRDFANCLSRKNAKGQAMPVLANDKKNEVYFFLAWLVAHLPAKACRSLSRLSRSTPDAVTP